MITIVIESCDKQGFWRTLSNDEWGYLFQSRKNATKLYGLAQVNAVKGLVILPDQWQTPDGIRFKPGINGWNENVYTIDQWAMMEENGALFFPAAGYRSDEYIDFVQRYGNYWSSSPYEDWDNVSCFLYFTDSDLRSKDFYDSRRHGFSVRLVKDL